MLDHERIYRLTHAADWPALLALIYEHPQAAAQDELVQRALDTFEQAFFVALDDGTLTAAQAEVLEKMILLHSGGIYRLGAERFATLVVRLVTWHLAHGADDTAAQYAPFCPDREPCASLIGEAEPRAAACRARVATRGGGSPRAGSRARERHHAGDGGDPQP